MRHCPHCGEDISNYDADDLIYWTQGGKVPFCSGDCVIATELENR